MEKEFIKGIDLCEDYYRDVVKGIIESAFSKLKYSAGLIDHGSEVLGYDNQILTDHDWGPRVMIFLDKDDIDLVKPKLLSSFDSKLPVHFKGYPVSFGKQGGDALKHRIDIYTPQSFFSDYLGFNISDKLEMKHWLLFPEQKLKTIRSGKLFCDGLNVENIRKKFFYYPKDVWLYLMACDWQKIGQEEPFVGRCGDVGDELGSSVIASRLVHIMMHLSFLMEQDYAPYSKWFGTAFLKLKCAKDLSPMFQQIFICNNWKDRE